MPPPLLRQGRQRLLRPHRHRPEQRRPPHLSGGRDTRGGGGAEDLCARALPHQQDTQAAPRPPGAHLQDGVRVQRGLPGGRVPQVAGGCHAGRYVGPHT